VNAAEVNVNDTGTRLGVGGAGVVVGAGVWTGAEAAVGTAVGVGAKAGTAVVVAAGKAAGA